MKISINKKGFTLVELLAVIVILAVLALVAMPNVTRLMENARKNSFTTEATQFAKDAQTAYTDIQLAGTISSDNTLSVQKDVPSTNNSHGSFDYFCISYARLKSDQYISKSNDNNYGGIIELFIPTSTNTSVNTTVTAVYLTNGSYAINGLSLNNLASGNYSAGTSGVAGKYNSGNTLTVKTAGAVSNANDGKLCLTTKEEISTEIDKLATAGQFN